MAIKIQKSRHVLTLISTSELYRILNVPKTRMLRAIREGVIRPAGAIGHATIIVMTKQDLKNWRAHFSHSEPQPLAKTTAQSEPQPLFARKSPQTPHFGVTLRKVNVK